jgi:hypothetical protein
MNRVRINSIAFDILATIQDKHGVALLEYPDDVLNGIALCEKMVHLSVTDKPKYQLKEPEPVAPLPAPKPSAEPAKPPIEEPTSTVPPATETPAPAAEPEPKRPRGRPPKEAPAEVSPAATQEPTPAPASPEIPAQVEKPARKKQKWDVGNNEHKLILLGILKDKHGFDLRANPEHAVQARNASALLAAHEVDPQNREDVENMVAEFLAGNLKMPQGKAPF